MPVDIPKYSNRRRLVADTAVRSNILKNKGVVTEDTTTKSKILKDIGKTKSLPTNHPITTHV